MAKHYTITDYSFKNKIIFLIAVVLLVSLLFIPYEEIRAERIRAFGENKAIGIVIDKSVRKEEQNKTNQLLQQYIVRYSFIDPSGLPRERAAIVEKAFWGKIILGDNIIVHYAKAQPGVSRLEHENESAVVKFLARFSRTNAH